MLHPGLHGVVFAPLFLLALAAPAHGQCPEWDARFHASGVDGLVFRQVVASYGGSPQLFIGGTFASVGSVAARNVASWDGNRWTSYGAASFQPVEAIAVHDDGSGPALYVGGWGFLNRWDGASWQTLPISGYVKTLLSFDDGGGPALFVGGQLGLPGSASQARLARHRAGSWESLNSGSGSSTDMVFALAEHDDGGGPALYVGGRFTELGGVAAARIARWDGATFAPLGAGLTGGGAPVVLALQSHTTPTGARELHVGGAFHRAGGAPAPSWAKWSGGAWSSVGGASIVLDLALRREATGTFVHAARGDGVERYDGVARSPLSFGGSAVVLAAEAFGTGPVDDLFASLSSGGRLHRWNGAAWESALMGLGLPGGAASITAHDFGAGEEVVVARTSPPPGEPLIVRFDGREWRSVGGAELVAVGTPKVESEGAELYCLGSLATGVRTSVARFDGVLWRPVGQPTPNGQTTESLALFDSGAGPELYVGGRFTHLGGVAASGIARFDSVGWVPVGGGVTSTGAGDGIRVVETWDDGRGPMLYAGGRFTALGGVAARSIGRWDGASWTPLGAGVESLPTFGFTGPIVADMLAFDAPEGERLVVAGTFDLAGGAPAANIAAWDGARWTPLGAGLTSPGDQVRVVALGVGDPDGRGERLFAAGTFELADGLPCNGAAVWDGRAWSPLPVASPLQPGGGGGINDFASSVAGGGRRVYTVGLFQTLGGVPSENIGALSDPCGEVTGTPVCTSTVNSSGRRGLLRASGSTSLAAAHLTFVARDLPAGVLTLLVNGATETRSVVGHGLLCVGGALRRQVPAGVSSSAGELVQAFDFHAPYAVGAIAGQSLVLQAFFRDTVTGAATLNSTDALRVQFRP